VVAAALNCAGSCNGYVLLARIRRAVDRIVDRVPRAPVRQEHSGAGVLLSVQAAGLERSPGFS